MRLQYIFHTKNTKPHPFHFKSDWIPRVQKSVALESYLESVKIQLAEIKPSKPKNNLSHNEYKALTELVNNTEINFKKADKVTTTVIMNKCDKIQEAQTHLNNRERYKPRKNGMAIETLQRVDELVSRLDQNNYIDDTTKKWFSQTRNPPRIPIFYTLTKIHKPNPVGRPIIISGCEGPTERLSSFVDKLLQPIAQTQKSYLKDTTHFINFMEKTTTILVSMDVTSLYTNIPQEEECRFLSRVEGRISRVESRGSRVQVIFKKLISYVLSYIKLICNTNRAVHLFSTFSPYACYESV